MAITSRMEEDMQYRTMLFFKENTLLNLLKFILILFFLIGMQNASYAQTKKPLLIPGKKTLYLRVVTHPGADLYQYPSEAAPVLQTNIKPFTVFYVYGKIKAEGTTWLETGLTSTGEIKGFIKEKNASEWLQALTLVFTERTGRSPVMFFNEISSLESVFMSKNPGANTNKLINTFNAVKSGKMDKPLDFPVSAVEPGEEAVSRDRFYLMPIFKSLEAFEGVKFLKAASIDPGTAFLAEKQELKTGIVFVIDTTISMKPYIDRTRESVRNIYDAIEKSNLTDKVAFGLVGFRNSTEASPGVEYVSRVFSDLRSARYRDSFEKALSNVKEADAPTHSFNEDSFAGLKTAVESLNWTDYQSRIILLVTDAGAIRNDDPYSTTQMNESEIADMAAAKGIKIFALHLKTPAGVASGRNNHAYAEAQYRALTSIAGGNVGDLYVPIEAKRNSQGLRGFGRVVESIADKMIELVRVTSEGGRLKLPELTTKGLDDVALEAARKAAVLGYAMQLDYLGKVGGVKAPEVVTSWVCDMDLAHPEIPALKVTILLTKNQLSDLHQRINLVLDNAQRTKRTGAKDFFQSILSAAAQMSRDPIQFSKNPNQNLGQLGFLSEFLEDLPYKSSIMRLTEEDWYRMSVGEQQAIVDDLRSKLRRYRQIHNDVANWETFGSDEPGDAVYRVPLNLMP